LLKPSPHLVSRALDALGANADEAVLVGDSTSDIDAARHAGVRTIGYANKPGKVDHLTNSGAQLVIDDLDALVSVLLASG
jgi:phosphoglycolate phosphatase